MLPSGYTQLEYIQSSGTQYVDTGFKPNNNTRVLIDVQYTAAPSTNAVLFGARTSATSKNYALMYTSGGMLRSDYNAEYTQEWEGPETSRVVIDKNKEATTIYGTSQSYTNATFQCDYNLYLLCLNNAGESRWFSSAKIYSCQIYDNDTLIRDYYPCVDGAGTACLYDAVTMDYCYNAGSGSFAKGAAA